MSACICRFTWSIRVRKFGLSSDEPAMGFDCGLGSELGSGAGGGRSIRGPFSFNVRDGPFGEVGIGAGFPLGSTSSGLSFIEKASIAAQHYTKPHSYMPGRRS
jgi:hypothetical protein